MFGHRVATCCKMLQDFEWRWIKYENDHFFLLQYFSMLQDVALVWPPTSHLTTRSNSVGLNCFTRLAGPLFYQCRLGYLLNS